LYRLSFAISNFFAFVSAFSFHSTGIKDKIQISKATHDLLVEAGKSHWVHPRPDAVQAKGKGTMKTFWLTPNAKRGTLRTGSRLPETKLDTVAAGAAPGHVNTKTLKKSESTMKQSRLVDWMVDMLQENIRKIIALRKPTSQKFKATYTARPDSTPLDDVAEVILLPRYDAKAFTEAQDHDSVKVSLEVLSQLREYVSIIALTYHDNHFHNFDHACHVAMATSKFIKRIVSPDIAAEEAQKGDLASKLHDYTHGINSDPLTVIAIVFSALIHDVDHHGVSNAQLIVEQPEMATIYRNKSIAEQNSLDIAWNLLMSDQFEDLRACLFSNQAELARFRQVLVNVVLATDIFDKELNSLRKHRWNRAFSECNLSDEDKNDLRATIVIEHIIQASDVCHTMQHWHIYRKWNKRLFMEMHAAFSAGRMAKDPSTFWYQGELGFFDNYIIPLAKKLKDCNVFGVSSDECLNYAIQNRSEWADRGQEIVALMINEIATISSVPAVYSNENSAENGKATEE
jgi:hypothetical protein